MTTQHNGSDDATTYTIDTALTLAGTGKFQYMVLAVAGVSSICVVIENQAIAYVMPTAKFDLTITLGEQGFINSVGFIGVLVASHFWGFLTDTWGRHQSLRLTLVCTCVTSAISSFAITSWMLIVTRFLVGVASVGIRIAGMSYLDEFLTHKNRSKYLSFYSSMTALGAIVQPMLGLAIMTRTNDYAPVSWLVLRPWRLFILLGSLVSAIAAVALNLLPAGPKQLMAMGREMESLAILQLIYRMNTGRPISEYSVQSIAVQDAATNLQDIQGILDGFKLVWTQTSALFKPPYVRCMVMLCLLMFVSIGVSQGIQMWFPQILANYVGIIDEPLTICEAVALGRFNELLNASNDYNSTNTMTTTAAPGSSPLTYYVIMTQGVSFLVINTMVGFLIERVGKTVMLSSRLLMNTLAAIGLIWVAQFYVNMALMIMLLSTIGLMNIVISTSGEMFTSRYKGMAISTMFMAGRIGSAAGSNIVGIMLYSHCNLLLILNATLLVGSTVLCYYLLRQADTKITANTK